ncbi:MAG: hypothetical protein ACLS70_11645 [[Clostridium] symbiosum]
MEKKVPGKFAPLLWAALGADLSRDRSFGSTSAAGAGILGLFTACLMLTGLGLILLLTAGMSGTERWTG